MGGTITCQHCGRVTQPGGRLCVINEPVISLLPDEQVILAQSAPPS